MASWDLEAQLTSRSEGLSQNKLSSKLGHLLPKSPIRQWQLDFNSSIIQLHCSCQDVCIYCISQCYIWWVACVMTLIYEQRTWFYKCVESYTRLPFMVHGLHEVCILFMYHEYKLQGKLLIVVKNKCIHLITDSNTRCTHLGGVHPMVCDFETNKFASLSFVVSRQS